MDLYFFLSYARGDDDSFVQQFFQDLSAEVRAYAGLHAADEVGFFDVHSIELGAVWRSRLVSALSECQTFIALCSPRYFLSEPCGKEWTVFASRMQDYERAYGVQTAAMQPLNWLPQRSIPPVVADLQTQTQQHSDAYTRNGLRQLMRLQRHRDSYLEFVDSLARQVVETAETHRIPRSQRSIQFEHVSNAFRPESSPSVGPSRPDAEADQAAHYVHFVVAAPTREQAARIREDTSFYGERPAEWAPYRPGLSSPIAEFAREVASRRSFQSAVADVDQLFERTDHARRHNQIVVLLVDVWATRLAPQREALISYAEQDERGPEHASAIMLPRSPDDQESLAEWQELSASVRSVFVKRIAGGDAVMFRPSILTHYAFEADLQVVLEVAKNRIFALGHVYRRPSDPPTQLPILQGP